ncbi:hypothetical protein J6590_082012 [Homalodisca vitripennis]|nr:hypothetical protein J6590_082012 [Homalodisca vitripennis]
MALRLVSRIARRDSYRELFCSGTQRQTGCSLIARKARFNDPLLSPVRRQPALTVPHLAAVQVTWHTSLHQLPSTHIPSV